MTQELKLADQYSTAEVRIINAKANLLNLQQELNTSPLAVQVAEAQETVRFEESKKIEVENTIIEQLQSLNLEEVVSSNWDRILMSTSTWSVKIEDEKDFVKNADEKFLKTTTPKPKTAPDKKAIKLALDEWENIEWVHLEKKITLKITKV